jgi:hypothetical protein
MCHISDIDELESHLKDEIDRLKSQGLSEQEAFIVGTHRLGKPDALADEFAKVNESLWLRTKCFWGGYALFAYIAANYAAETLSKTFLLLATSLGLRGYAAGIFEPVSRMTIFLLIIFLWFVMIALVAACTVLPAAIIHTVGAQGFSQIAMPTALLMLSGWVIEPVVMMMVLIYLRPTTYSKIAVIN